LTQDPWVQFANNQTACILQEEDQLLSFCVIGQDLTFNKAIAEAMNLDAKKSISLLYLFTVQHYQRQQNAQQLGTYIINHIKTQLPHIKYII
jgi:hypothetical protein